LAYEDSALVDGVLPFTYNKRNRSVGEYFAIKGSRGKVYKFYSDERKKKGSIAIKKRKRSGGVVIQM